MEIFIHNWCFHRKRQWASLNSSWHALGGATLVVLMEIDEAEGPEIALGRLAMIMTCSQWPFTNSPTKVSLVNSIKLGET